MAQGVGRYVVEWDGATDHLSHLETVLRHRRDVCVSIHRFVFPHVHLCAHTCGSTYNHCTFHHRFPVTKPKSVHSSFLLWFTLDCRVPHYPPGLGSFLHPLDNFSAWLVLVWRCHFLLSVFESQRREWMWSVCRKPSGPLSIFYTALHLFHVIFWWMEESFIVLI